MWETPASAGIHKGDRIGILGKNRLEYFLLCGAAAAMGAIVLPINWRLTADEILFNLKDCEPVDVLSDDGFVSIHTAAVAGRPREALLSHINILSANLVSFMFDLFPILSPILEPQALIDFVGERFARLKKTQYVEFSDDIPVLEDGTVDRGIVKKMYGGEQ